MALDRLIALRLLFIGAAFALPSGSCADVRHVGTVETGDRPIEVLVWNNALGWGHVSRVKAIPYLTGRQASDNIHYDLRYAHTEMVTEGPSDTSFDASVFTDAGLDQYDVILFLHPTGTTIDDEVKDVRRQALRDFIEKKGRGFVGTHSATDTYQNGTWPWYVDFIGANYMTMKPNGPTGGYTQGTLQAAQGAATHPILASAHTPNPWNRWDEWFVFSSDPTLIDGITMLLIVSDQRPSAWIHEMPVDASGSGGGRMFYTACCHDSMTFADDNSKVIDLIVAGIKWAAHRL